MIKKTLPLVAFMALSYSAVSYSAVVPEGTNFDNRIKTVHYNPDDVYKINVRLGTATLIQLEEGETVDSDNSGLGIGDANGWTIAVRGNNIFMKPKERSPDTNINLVTNKRTYSFSLESVKRDSSAAYIVRFDYPEPEPSPWELSKQDMPCTDTPVPAGEHVNYAYTGWGDSELSPSFIWDDGKFTCFKYPSNDEIPAIYRVTPEGEEAMVNSNVAGDTIVVHTTSKEFRLRLGNRVMGVKTQTDIHAPYNYKGTSVPGTFREVNKDGE